MQSSSPGARRVSELRKMQNLSEQHKELQKLQELCTVNHRHESQTSWPRRYVARLVLRHFQVQGTSAVSHNLPKGGFWHVPGATAWTLHSHSSPVFLSSQAKFCILLFTFL